MSIDEIRLAVKVGRATNDMAACLLDHLDNMQKDNMQLRSILQRYSELSDKSGGYAWCVIRQLPGAVKWLKDLRTALKKTNP